MCQITDDKTFYLPLLISSPPFQTLCSPAIKKGGFAWDATLCWVPTGKYGLVNMKSKYQRKYLRNVIWGFKI